LESQSLRNSKNLERSLLKIILLHNLKEKAILQ
jgi:hypothetical protein